MIYYTSKRFFSNCSGETEQMLREAWDAGNVLTVEDLPPDAVPCVVIIAGFARLYQLEIVDDYELLLGYLQQECAKDTDRIQHPDMFFASSILQMFLRDEEVTLEGFRSIGVPQLWAEFFGEPL